MDVEITMETRDVTVTKTFVTIEGEEFDAGVFLDVLDNIKDTDGYMTGLRNLNPEAKKIIEKLEELGFVGHTYSAGWFAKDEESLSEIWSHTMDMFYEDFKEE